MESIKKETSTDKPGVPDGWQLRLTEKDEVKFLDAAELDARIKELAQVDPLILDRASARPSETSRWLSIQKTVVRLSREDFMFYFGIPIGIAAYFGTYIPWLINELEFSLLIAVALTLLSPIGMVLGTWAVLSFGKWGFVAFLPLAILAAIVGSFVGIAIAVAVLLAPVFFLMGATFSGALGGLLIAFPIGTVVGNRRYSQLRFVR